MVKKKWDASNPLYRYMHKVGGWKGYRKGYGKNKRVRAQQVRYLAKHRRGGFRGSRGMLGGFSIKKIAIGAGVGIAATYLVPMVLNKLGINLNLPKELVAGGAGFAAGGIPGALAGAGASMLLGNTTSSVGASAATNTL